MLVLTRKVGESIVIPSLGITIKLTAIDRGQVKLGIDAPADIRILRSELLPDRELYKESTYASREKIEPQQPL